jgi:hypothetical protein
VTEDPWGRFVDRLTIRFQDLARGDTVILSRGVHHVQLTCLVDVVHAEAVSDAGLPPDQQLTVRQKDALTSLGWRPPTPVGDVNYWYEILAPPAPSDSQRLAGLFVGTLRDVYGVESPGELEVEAWNDETGQPVDVTW